MFIFFLLCAKYIFYFIAHMCFKKIGLYINFYILVNVCMLVRVSLKIPAKVKIFLSFAFHSPGAKVGIFSEPLHSYCMLFYS